VIPPKPPLFLARASYRQRRLRDAARLLPVIAGILWMIPLLWPRGQVAGAGAAQSTSGAIIYFFGVWVLLILCAAFLARRVRPDKAEAMSREAE
jgi:hypothetical protein